MPSRAFLYFSAVSTLFLSSFAACTAGPDNTDVQDDRIESRTAELSICKKQFCGPQPLGMPNVVCSDGSTGGPTGRCILHPASNTCGWEVRDCPSSPTPPPPPPRDCSTKDACGPAPGMPNQICGDGSVGGPECVAGANGECSWSIRVCPTDPTQPPCGKTTCSKTQTCCDGIPFDKPTCVEGTMCPISQKKHKKDIAYLSQEERQRLNDELMSFRLATYRYKTEGAAEREHLGFIIDDVAPSAAVTSTGERVDMYGYQTMAVAALQTQAREIGELRRELDAVRRELEKTRAKR